MPAFDIAPELFASIKYTVVIVLIVNRSCEAVAKHAFCERRKRIDWVFFQKSRGRRGISFGRWYVRVNWRPKLKELILSYRTLECQLLWSRQITTRVVYLNIVYGVNELTSSHSS